MFSQRKPYTVATLFFLALFLISFFFFSFSTRITLHPSPSIHSDLYLRLQPLSPPPPPPPPLPLPLPPPPHSSPATTTQTQPEPVGDTGKVSHAAESDAEPVTENVGEDVALKLKECDLFTGTWVRDENNYPIYQAGSCPYVDEAYDCKVNGRTDTLYTKWRWKPHACDLPRFNATDFLVRLKGKRLMLVGDSMNRNQFESILCMLREGLQNKSRMYEVHGHKITKGRGYFVFKFEASAAGLHIFLYQENVDGQTAVCRAKILEYLGRTIIAQCYL